ncbi:Alpha-keto acid-binding periplasmic protein TakP [bacterium HR40]|nr:Alpha-keto acid-binding periplasmic protein TakP [bacterium HR40]
MSRNAPRRAAIVAAICGLLAGLPTTVLAGKVRIELQGGYGSNIDVLGPGELKFVELANTLSGGSIEVRFHEPNALVPVLQSFDAVASGALDAAYTGPGFWTGKDVTFALLGAVPFGPGTTEFLAWVQEGGGRAFWEELYGRFNIVGIPCGLLPPEGSGWFRRPIDRVEDLRGLKMRFYGLGARVMEKLGVSTQLIAGGEIYQALQLGTIDATEFSMPSIDLSYGFYQVAKYYYFPGWHQQASFLDLMISRDKWNTLDDTQRAIVRAACDATILWQIGYGEARQGPALAELAAKGVEIRTWPPEVLDAMRAAWTQVVEELKTENATFARAWQSLEDFRRSYRDWAARGHMRE